MSVTMLQEWRQDGCDRRCFPRSHDPEAHREDGYAAGYAQALRDQQPSVVRTGPLAVDLGARTVAIRGQTIRVSGREYAVLAYLAAHVGRWREVDEVVVGVWGPPELRVPRVARCNNLNTVIARLRQRLGVAASLVESRHLGCAVHRRLRVEEPTC
jgi:DNA-binding response OmpR family regulator